MTTDAIDTTIEALERRAGRDERNFGLGFTEGAQRLISRHFKEYLGLFQGAISEAKAFRGRKRELLQLEPEVLTLAALEYGISSFNTLNRDYTHETSPLSLMLWYIGHALENECYGKAFRDHNAKEAEWIEGLVQRSAGNLAYRKRMLKLIASRKGFEYKPWSDNDVLQAAVWVVDVLTRGPLFTLDDEKNLTMTALALSEVDQIMADMVLCKPRGLPQTGPVQLWESTTLHLDSLPYMLVRTPQATVRKFVEREFRAGSMGPTLDAINHSQSVLWRINDRMVELVKWAYEQDLGRAVGLPAKDNLELPFVADFEALSEPEKVRFMREKREKKTANRGFIGERIVLAQHIATAERLSGAPFWTPMNLDYRGRVYAIPSFNFQAADHIRSMFEFNEGQVLTEEGLYWLKVHVANCGAFDKIDKASFNDRVKWVDDNWLKVFDIGNSPRDPYNQWWMKADKPFMFVAACRALRDALGGKPVHIPVSFDGTCSGLQHLCAMTRAPEGALVNLTPTEKPNDVYQTVATRVEERIKADLGGEFDAYAKMFLGFGITRSLVKRNVMTYSYSSKASGMTSQVLEDTIKPLNFKVLVGELPANPFGEDEGQWKVANYLARHTYAAIEEVVEGPARAMEFLRSIAGAYAHEEKPTIWHTPLGFPVMMRYPNKEVKQVKLFLHDRGIYFTPSASYEVPGIKKSKSKNGIAPSFVHSLDACHLMMVLLACKQEGINSVALVHDSFGCLPNDCGRFRTLIKQTFRDLYAKNDVLGDIRKEALERLDNPKLPEPPTMGSLDLDQIMQAEYSFA